MAHLTTFTFEALPAKRGAIVEQFERWEREQRAKATGFEYSLLVSSNANPDQFTIVVQFDSTDNYRKNSDRPEIDAWYQALRANLVADPEWFDGTVTRETRA